MTTVEILRAAREKISDPSRWTRLTYARDQLGAEVDADDKSAVCFCSMGAIYSVTSDDFCGQNRAVSLLYNAAHEISGSRSVVRVNDNLGHEAVVRMFDLAITTAEGL